LRIIDVVLRARNQISLCQNDDRSDVGIKRQGDVTLQPGDIEILITGRHDKRGIDVGRDQLHLAIGSLSAAFQKALSVQNTA